MIKPIEQRGLADLRGAAGHAARRRDVRRALRRKARREAMSRRSLARLRHRVQNARQAEDACAEALLRSRGHPPLRLQPRTINALVGLMTLCDALLVSSALQEAKRALTPAAALILAGGIGLALVLLGKRLGHELAAFDRLRDQSARWGVIAALSAVVVAIASVGLTLLRLRSVWSWPLLTLAVPAGSAALAWLTDDPEQLDAARSQQRLRRIRRSVERCDTRFTRHLATAARHWDRAEHQYRAALAPSLRRAITDGALPPELQYHSMVLERFVADHLRGPCREDLLRQRGELLARLEGSSEAASAVAGRIEPGVAFVRRRAG